MHTIFDKSYIGYTSKSLEERLHKHIINALSGIDTKFYRCIRNHGPKNIISKILIECNDEVEVKQLEKNYIKQYENCKEVPIHFVGSIAFYLKEELEMVLSKHGIKVGNVLRRPIDGLIAYHSINK